MWWQQVAITVPYTGISAEAFFRAEMDRSVAMPHICLQTPTSPHHYSSFYSLRTSYSLCLAFDFIWSIMMVLIFLSSKSPTLLLYLWKNGLSLWCRSALFLLDSISNKTCLLCPSLNSLQIVDDKRPFPAPNYT